MAKQTLLEMTQGILSSLDSGEVNSIGDNPESLQVANIIKSKYYDIVSRGTLPENKKLFTLDPSLDIDKPVMMIVPEGVSEIEWIKYFDTNPQDSQSESQFGAFSHGVNTDIQDNADTSTDVSPLYKYVTILPLAQFLEFTAFNLQQDDVQSFSFEESGNSFTFYYKNDHQPQYCTIISNKFVVFDMYDASQDSTLQASKSMCYGYITPNFLMEDTFIPEMSDDQFPLLFNEAKALAFFELKQTPHLKAEQEIKRGWSSIQKNKSIADKPSYFDQLPSFGRQPRTGGYGTIWPRLKPPLY